MMPTPFTIGIKRHQTGATDAHGNKVESWAAPIYVGVYSIAPAMSNEPFEAGRELVITGLTVLAPATVEIDRRDIVVIDGEDYTVEGEAGNWNQGPFGFEPGISVSLRRVEG